MFGTDGWYSKTYWVIKDKKEEVLKKGRYFRVAVTFGGLLLLGITRKVLKLTLLLGSRYFPGAATFGTLWYTRFICDIHTAFAITDLSSMQGRCHL